MRAKSRTTSVRTPLVLSAQSVGLLAAFAFLSWTAFSIGFANLLTTAAAQTGRVDIANSAIRVNPQDPEAHHVRSAILVNDDPPAANSESTLAVALRPRDYIFWLGLAQTRELNYDLGGAIDAATQAARLAPSYSQPHWRLGNLLVRAGRSDEGFTELRLAGKSNPSLWPSIIDLAWHLSSEDAEYVKRAVQPNTTDGWIELSDYFRARGKFSEAVQTISAADASARSYRRRLLEELISRKSFADAYQLWTSAQVANSDKDNPIFDPGFEQGSDLTEPGFGWRAGKSQHVTVAVDSQTSSTGNASLRVDFNGESDPNTLLLSQVVMVQPNSRYTLKFMGRSEKLISGGLPEIRILDAVSGVVLGNSVLRQQTDGWVEYSIDFALPANASAIEIGLRRQTCATNPCPIFGTLWLDN